MFESTKSDDMIQEYKSLDEIRLRKAQLLTDITKDSNKIQGIWNGIFHKPKGAVPAKRFSNIMSTGFAAVDGAFFAWKLYRKMKGKSGFGFLKKKKT